MELRRRIFISSPRDKYLDPKKKEAKWKIINLVESFGYEAQVFNPEDGGRGLARGLSWNIQTAQMIMEKCVGAVLIGFAFWKNCHKVNEDANSCCALVSEYTQFEGALAKDLGIPILSLLERGVEERLVFMGYSGDIIVPFFSEDSLSYFMDNQLKSVIKAWHSRIEK